MKLTQLALALTTATLLATAIATPVQAEPAARRATVSDGERAFAALQVQNVMSKHTYMHSVGLNRDEVDALWVSPTGKFAKTATFSSPMWVMNGIPVIRAAYGDENERNREAALKALNAVDPTVKFEPANLGAGHEWVMHTTTTPLIEVAGDGQTAKGMWYSPGMGLMAHMANGQATVGGTFFWEKYAGDFVKENGVWKIWHLQMAYDFTPAIPKEWTKDFAIGQADPAAAEKAAAAALREAGERMSGTLPPGFSKPKFSYPAYSVKRPSIVYPPLPQPYYTFKETFSYCNCDQ